MLDKAALLKAVELSKTDLTAELVKEFTELQGIVGGLYARAQGLGDVCAGRSIGSTSGIERRCRFHQQWKGRFLGSLTGSINLSICSQSG